MEKYEDLIDVVSTIVRTYGVGILSESKFWNVLSDSYRFASDYSLRREFKKSIKDGYVSQLVSLKGDSEETRKKIQTIIDSEKAVDPNTEKGMAAVLFSVAIALGSLTKNDYSLFLKGKRIYPNTTPAPKPTRPTKPNPITPSNLSTQQYASLSLIVFFGIVMTYGASILYSTFFNGWWLFAIVLLTGAVQVVYLGFVMAHLDETKDAYYKGIAKSIIIPFLDAMMLNGVMAFFFFSRSFRRWLSLHLGFSGYAGDGPSILSFVLIMIYLIFMGTGCAMCLSPDSKNISPNFNNVNKKIVIRTAAFLILGYILLFFYPKVTAAIYENHIRQEQQEIDRRFNQQVKNNREIQAQRNNQSVELSFKGIQLGSSFDGEMQEVDTISDVRAGTESYYSIKIDGKIEGEEGIFDPSSCVKRNRHLYGSNGIEGILYSGITSLDNQIMEIDIFEYNKVVSMITLRFDFHIKEFEQLVDLYTSKYGEPERMTISGLPFKENPSKSYERRKHTNYYANDYEDLIKNDYVWTYENGIIRLSIKQITYVTADFLKSIKKMNEELNAQIKQREVFVADSVRQEDIRRDAIRRKKEYEDSVSKAKNHSNAIHEI